MCFYPSSTTTTYSQPHNMTTGESNTKTMNLQYHPPPFLVQFIQIMKTRPQYLISLVILFVSGTIFPSRNPIPSSRSNCSRTEHKTKAPVEPLSFCVPLKRDGVARPTLMALESPPSRSTSFVTRCKQPQMFRWSTFWDGPPWANPPFPLFSSLLQPHASLFGHLCESVEDANKITHEEDHPTIDSGHQWYISSHTPFHDSGRLALRHSSNSSTPLFCIFRFETNPRFTRGHPRIPEPVLLP